MTTRAKVQYARYLRAQEEDRKRFIAGIKALTPKQKTQVLIDAGVLTKQGKFTARYRTPARGKTTTARRSK